MGIEQWHLNHALENPAYLCLMRLNKWCEGLDLSPKTVKVINDLREVPHYTALGARMGINPDSSRLTPQEQNLIETKEIQQEQNLIETKEIQNVPAILIVDIDGVLVSIWPALVDFWKKWKESPTLSPSQIWKKLEESIAQARPPWWETLLPLARMAKVADQVIIWTNRVPVNQESIFWKIARRIFDDETWLERFPFFSQQAAEKLKNARPFQNKTQVLVGFPKKISLIIQKIEEMGDPYVIYVGSSFLDIRNFKRIIEKLRRREDPFDRIVFCSTNHLIL
jgi:hypothetical protein